MKVDEAKLKRAYLRTGAISLVVKLARGEHVQIAMVGRDTISRVLGARRCDRLEQRGGAGPGVASTIDLDQLRAAAEPTTPARHGLAVYAQIQHTAGCNASHTVECPGWRDACCTTCYLSGSDKLVLTQELMAQMIGARRNSVSLVANTRRTVKVIDYSRGHIEIVKFDGLMKTSCECYATGSKPSTRAAAATRALRGVMVYEPSGEPGLRTVPIRTALSHGARRIAPDLAFEVEPYRIITTRPRLRGDLFPPDYALFNDP